jgi:hypothetical protein
MKEFRALRLAFLYVKNPASSDANAKGKPDCLYQKLALIHVPANISCGCHVPFA